VSALISFIKKMNIYGWDYHLKKSPKRMNYLQLIYNSYDYECDSRSLNHFETTLVNLYFGYKISKMPNIKVHSYLGHLQKHEKMINKIEKVLYEQ